MIRKNNIAIKDIKTWEIHGAPAGKDKHWVDGRSAKESARYWIGVKSPDLPVEIDALMQTHPDFGPLLDWMAEPEAKTPFDNYRGQPSNIDLLIEAEDVRGEFIIGIEAKADETFGDLIKDKLNKTLETKIEKQHSNNFQRVFELATAIFTGKTKGAKVVDLRYQLLTGIAGTLAEAERKKCSRAVFIIQEFCTDKTADEKHAANQSDLIKFMSRISDGTINGVESGNLYGPFRIAGSDMYGSADLYIGKVVCNMRT